jgi:flavin reductase (DIM6/NTAB) family NADH-FMN oxidoreductase RutF
MEYNPDELTQSQIYKLLIGSIVPRPIGWISTVNEAGQPNLAPFSYFNAIGSTPPSLMFAPSIRGVDGQSKDTLRNIQSTREFVANIVTETLAEAMNLTSTELPAEVDEFVLAGLTKTPSAVVRPPRVAESPIHFECRVTHILLLGEEPGSDSIVIGRIVHMHVAAEVLLPGDKIDLDVLKPIGRLAGSSYCRVTDLFSMPRPSSKIT